MGTARKTRHGMQSDGERKGRKKKDEKEHKQRKEDQKQMENEKTNREAASTKLLRRSPGLMVPILVIASIG